MLTDGPRPRRFDVVRAALIFVALAAVQAPSPAHADGEQSYPEPQSGNGNYNVNYKTLVGTGSDTVGNTNKIVSQDPGSSNLDTLDGQITSSPTAIGSANNFDWAAGLLEYVGGYFGSSTATITVPANTTVSGQFGGSSSLYGFAAGLMADMVYGQSGTPALVVNNSGTVSGAVTTNNGVAAGIDSYVDFGDQDFSNYASGSLTATASWYTSGIRAVSNYGNINAYQYGSLTATSKGGAQGPYNNTGWSVGLDLQTYIGNITVTNTGTTTGTVQSVSGSNEACGAYIWADTDTGSTYYNPQNPGGDMTLNNTGTFSAVGAANGVVKGVYCGGNGQTVTVNNSGTISATCPTGGGWALETEIDGPGSMFINNSGTLTTNAISGLFIVSTTNSDPNSGGTGPVRVENTGTIQGGTGINSAYYNGPITLYDHSTITGTGGSAVSLSNSKPNAIYVYGTPRIQGTMYSSSPGSTLHLHITGPLTSVNGKAANSGPALSSYNLGTSGSLVAAGQTYSWRNMAISGSTAAQDIPSGTYTLTNRYSSLLLDEPAGHTADGTSVDQQPLNNGQNQQWTITNLGNGLYRIVNDQSGRSLDDYGWGTDDGNVIDIWDLASPGQANQEWLFTPTDSGCYTISPACAPGSCIDVPYASQSASVTMQLYTLDDADVAPNGGWGQQWKPILVPVRRGVGH